MEIINNQRHLVLPQQILQVLVSRACLMQMDNLRFHCYYRIKRNKDKRNKKVKNQRPVHLMQQALDYLGLQITSKPAQHLCLEISDLVVKVILNHLLLTSI